MLRFITENNTDLLCFIVISIHPMLRFIEPSQNGIHSTDQISIHPMLRFICTGYIQRNACYVISIHPMLRFITIPWKYAKLAERFQYIPCYGLSQTCLHLRNHQNISIHPMLRFITTQERCRSLSLNFNTSHVTVYRYSPFELLVPSPHFNTSHVTVYLMILSHFYLGIFHHFLYFTSFQHFLPADYKI